MVDTKGLVNALVAAGPVAVAVLVWLWRKRKAKKFLDKIRKKIKVIEIQSLSHDTKLFRLGFPSKDMILGLPVGKHIQLFTPNPQKCRGSGGLWNGRACPDKGTVEVKRAYTPTTGDNTPGYTDLVIKIYRPGTVRMPDGREMQWEDGGKMGLVLDKVKVGDDLEIDGPFGLVEYFGKGAFKLPGNRTPTVTAVGMVAGGTGLTPMLQVMQASLLDPADNTTFSLIYANKTEDDILVRNLLDQAVAEGRGRIKVYYTLDFPPDGWTGGKGFVSEDMIKAQLPAPGADSLVLMCGPPPMVEACKKNLAGLGYPKDTFASF